MMKREFFGALARHTLTALGLSLVADGKIDAAGADQLVGGGMIVFGLGWSFAQKTWRSYAS